MATFEVWSFVLSLGHSCLVFLNTDAARGQAGD